MFKDCLQNHDIQTERYFYFCDSSDEGPDWGFLVFEADSNYKTPITLSIISNDLFYVRKL